MRIIKLLINEDVTNGERRLQEATSENVIEILRENLVFLAGYRKLLVNLHGIPELNFNSQTGLGRGLIEETRAAVLEAVKSTIEKQNLTEALLDSFLLINGDDAVDTFNLLFYMDSGDWEKQGGKLCAPDREDMSIASAVEKCGRLRREVFVADGMTFFRNEKAVAAWHSHPGKFGFLERRSASGPA